MVVLDKIRKSVAHHFIKIIRKVGMSLNKNCMVIKKKISLYFYYIINFSIPLEEFSVQVLIQWKNKTKHFI